MIVFLTSSPSGPLNKPNDERLLDKQNQFVENLKHYRKPEMKGLMIAAFPCHYEQNDEMTAFFKDAFSNSGIPFQTLDLWDERILDKDLSQYDIVILAGGHVPTQNAYFQSIKLREKLETYQGLVLGISAGSMNSADIVYAQPELSGETNPHFSRWLKGLNLTKIHLLPHYQMVKDYMLDGKRLFEDVTYPDSYQAPFYCLVDGSYVLIENEKTTLFGEAYLIKDGQLQIINTTNSSLILDTTNL